MSFEGGCLCGEVRYEIRGEARSMTHCHCSMCRKAHGAAFATFIEFARSDFHYTRGEDSIERYLSSPGSRRPFCRSCGSTLLFETEDTEEIWIACGSLDGDPGCRPGSHIFVASKAAWFHLDDELPKFDADTDWRALRIVGESKTPRAVGISPEVAARLAPRVFRDRLRGLRDRARFEFPPDSIPAGFRRAAVLVLFWEEQGEVRVLLTRRAARMSRNAGQVSFPGGMLEGDEPWEEGALREAEEEVGLSRNGVELMGWLDDAWSGTGSHLVSVVAWLDSPPALAANPAEVSRILTPSARELLQPGVISEEQILKSGVHYRSPIIEWSGGKVHGLSADLLIEALTWGIGEELGAGAGRLADLESLSDSL
jgi:8-oxo-dGTP pyrophosphatase MutT (NUDIX family)